MKSLYLLLLLSGSVSIVLPIVTRKYYLIQEGKNWNDAQAYCQATYTDLAIIDSNDNMVQLQSEAQIQQFSSSAWIGLYSDINSWRWSYGNVPLGSMTKWYPGQPDNRLGNQTCGGIFPTGWIDKTCSDKFPFVCFDDSKTGSERFIMISDRMTWPAARSYCRQHYTDLATITDETENLIVLRFALSETWIGLYRDGWIWLDKTLFSTSSWITFLHDPVPNKDCGHLTSNLAGNGPCSDIMPFFCYRDIRKKLTIQVKIQSNQDIIDSAVAESILEKITQKLKDHGVAENTTVKWRVYPDGLVFQKMKRNDTAENVILGNCDI